jgi:hypothetical protein
VLAEAVMERSDLSVLALGMCFQPRQALQVNIDRKPQVFHLNFSSRLITLAMSPQNKKLLFRQFQQKGLFFIFF